MNLADELTKCDTTPDGGSPELSKKNRCDRKLNLPFSAIFSATVLVLSFSGFASSDKTLGSLRKPYNTLDKQFFRNDVRRIEEEEEIESEWIETSEEGVEEDLTDIEWVEEPEAVESEGEDLEIIHPEAAENQDGLFENQEAEEFDEEFEVQQIRERLLPARDLDCGPNGGPAKQFAHLHHMKTGGTSLNKAIKCALSRAQKTHNQRYIPYSSLSECKWSRFQNCMTGKDGACVNNIDKAMVMQFCAPLFSISHFDWLSADLVTMLRHPVDRVWSMYRYQTKSCYKCHTLLETFQRIENATTAEICGKCEGVCMTQLSNHLVRNLLTTDPLTLDQPMTDEEMLNEAIWNMKNRVAFVGVTEQLDATWAMMGEVFPWLNVTVDGSGETCDLPHANKTPKNNKCGPNMSHMELPPEPDKETKEMILKHNQLDLQLYQEAARWFELQKRALGFSDEVE